MKEKLWFETQNEKTITLFALAQLCELAGYMPFEPFGIIGEQIDRLRQFTKSDHEMAKYTRNILWCIDCTPVEGSKEVPKEGNK